jgi:methionine aminopeptidase
MLLPKRYKICIGQAVHGVDADAAFAMLVDKSQRTNTKLWTVAEDLLANVRTVET